MARAAARLGIRLVPSSSSSPSTTLLTTALQVVTIPLDSKGALAQELLKAQGGEERMVGAQGQQVLVAGPGQGSRPQDAIASILASMNQSAPAAAEQGLVSLASPVDYSAGEQVVTMVEAAGAEVAGVTQPLNLATIQGGQAIQVQGIKRVAQSSPGGGIVSKKVIIATINGTQRILTPVSSPQMIAVKSNPAQRLVTAEASLQAAAGTPLTIIQQKPTLQQAQQQLLLQQRPKLAVTSPTAVKSVDNKTCRWKFENGQICGKVFTKTYNLTVHMRMHQDIRPFPCTICEQTFRQKAHLQRHEATHGIDSTAGRKRRKKSLLEGMEGMGVVGRRMSESEEEEGVGGEEELYRHSFPEAKRKFTVMKTEGGAELELDPMIEPIEGSGSAVRRAVCPVTVGTNTDAAREARAKGGVLLDELEEDMEVAPARYRREAGAALQVEQGVQYCEADLLDQADLAAHQEVKFVPGAIDAPQVAAIQTQVSMAELMGDEVAEKTPGLKVEGEGVEYSSQGQHYVDQERVEERYMEEEELVGEEQHQLIDSDGSYIDASANQLVMSGDGGLVRLVSMHQGENVVNIVTSTATNEHGQQIVIIENLDQHSPELQREIMRALLADPSIVPISSS